MRLLLRRKFKGDAYTVGDLFIDGEFFCNTIEDRVRELPFSCPDTSVWKNCTCKEKVYAETAIPAGIYKVTMEQSPRFKRVLPYLHNVPHFLGILIHNGAHASHSAGCVLVGRNTVKGGLTKSRVYSDRLNEILLKATDITIEIV